MQIRLMIMKWQSTITWFECLVMPSRKGKCQFQHVLQHPKNMMIILLETSDQCKTNQCVTPQKCRGQIWITKVKLNLFEETWRMTWQRTRWSIKPLKDLAPNNFYNVVLNVDFNVILQNIWRWKHCTKQIIGALNIA